MGFAFLGTTRRRDNVSAGSGQAAVVLAWAAGAGAELLPTAGGTERWWKEGGSAAEWGGVARGHPH